MTELMSAFTQTSVTSNTFSAQARFCRASETKEASPAQWIRCKENVESKRVRWALGAACGVALLGILFHFEKIGLRRGYRSTGCDRAHDRVEHSLGHCRAARKVQQACPRSADSAQSLPSNRHP